MKSHSIPAAILLVFVALSGSLLASTNEHPGSVPILLGLDSVRHELGLSKNQCLELDKIRSDFKSDVRLVTANVPSDPVGKKAANSTVKDLLAKYNEKALSVLNPAQAERFAQIERQTLGGLILFFSGVQKQVGLAPEQIASIDKIRVDGESFANRVTSSFEKGEITLPERLEILKSYRNKQSVKVLRILTPAQRKTFETMQGNPFKPA